VSTAKPFPDDDDLWGEFWEEIDRRLNLARPARSSPIDRGWMQPIFGWARNHIPNEENLVRHFAEREVVARESKLNRKANRLLKRYASGQQALTWTDLGPLPFTLDTAGLRVRFDAATPDDFEGHARHIRGRAKQTFQSELAVAAALDDMAKMARVAGHARVAMLGDLPIREDGRYAELEWDDEWDNE
jgi:hypothetical protein